MEHFLRAKPINQAMTGWLGPRALTGLMSLCCLVSISIAAQPDMSDVIFSYNTYIQLQMKKYINSVHLRRFSDSKIF